LDRRPARCSGSADWIRPLLDPRRTADHREILTRAGRLPAVHWCADSVPPCPSGWARG
jgi:hypothetical protein